MAPRLFAAALSRRDALAAAAEILGTAGIASARADAEWLLAGLLGVGRAALYLEGDVSADVAARYAHMVERRAGREPLQRLLGWEEFYGLRFRLTDAVLVPRPETEVLVDWALGLLPPPSVHRLTAVDVGSGSGCIACALAWKRTDLDVIALDASLEAAAMTQANAMQLAVSARVHVVAGDLVTAMRSRRADLIVSNPPYLPTESLRLLAPEVADHDPRQALDGGPDGLGVIRRLVGDARDRLVPGGVLALETAGGAQAHAAAALMNEAGFRRVLVHNDLAGIERFAAGRG
jgi:release factor glutamine methyltransferase